MKNYFMDQLPLALGRAVFRSAASALVVAALTIPAHGQTWTWTGEAGTTAWTDGGNWDQGSAPTTNGANITQHVEISFGTIESGAREIGRNTTGSTQTVTGGNLIITGNHRYGVLTGSEGSGSQTAGTVTSSGIFQLGVQNGTSASYSLSGSGILQASHFAIASGGADTVATFNQSGGTFRTDGPSGAFIGHLGTGTYNLSGGTFSRDTSGGVSVGIGASATGHLNQTGGKIRLTGGSGLTVSGTNGGNGTYSISNGSIDAGYLTVGDGLSGVVNIGVNADMNFTGDFSLLGNGVVNFAFGETGVSSMSFDGEGIIDAGSEVYIDGAAFVGAPQTFTLISADSFSDTPSISLINFAQETNYNWNETEGLFTVTVIPEPSTYAALFGLFVLGLAFYRRRSS